MIVDYHMHLRGQVASGPEPLVHTVDAIERFVEVAAARGVSRTDFALWGGLVPGGLSRLPELAERGVVGFKAFMSGSGIDDFAAADDATLWQGMRVAGELGLPVLVHAENDGITAALARQAIAAGRTGIRDYLASRPVVAEVEAIRRAITLEPVSGRGRASRYTSNRVR